MKTIVYILVFAAGFLSIKANACSCEPRPNVDTAFEYASMVMTGTVLRKEEIENASVSPEGQVASTPLVASYTFVVTAFYKGKVNADTVIVYTSPLGTGCSYPFEVGKRYVVYAYKAVNMQKFSRSSADKLNQHIFYTNYCQRTGPFDQKEIDALEKVVANRDRK